MKIPYYPGCTLNTVAKGFDTSTRESARVLGIELKELSQWNCCGAVFPLTPDNIMGLAGATKVLSNAEKEGDKVTTLCSFCYNVLKRTKVALDKEDEKRDVINEFHEIDYSGRVEVIHFLEVLRDEVGFDNLKEKVVLPLKDLKVAAYYGCMLLRPFEEVGIDDHESPTIFEDFLRALGCEVVDYPKRIDCCGAHVTINREDIVSTMSGNVLLSAFEMGAEAVVTSCPLCLYNLEKSEDALVRRAPHFKYMPVVYFSQLLGLALKQDETLLGLDKNLYDIRPMLKKKGIMV